MTHNNVSHLVYINIITPSIQQNSKQPQRNPGKRLLKPSHVEQFITIMTLFHLFLVVLVSEVIW